MNEQEQEPVAWQEIADPDHIITGDIWDDLKSTFRPLYAAAQEKTK